jgi:tetratricopeptide (TPR) repeat protein
MIIQILLTLQAACTYPAEPAGVTRDMRRAVAVACQQQIAANPQDLKAYQTLGWALLDSPGEALEVYQAGLSIAPDNYSFQVNAGYCLRQLNRFSEALAALKRAATLDTGSRSADALAEAGLVAQRMKRHDEAVALLRDALVRGPHYPPPGHTWGYLARSLYEQKKYREAVAAWERADTLSPRGFIDEAGDRALYERSRSLSKPEP